MIEQVFDLNMAADDIANIEKHCFSTPWNKNQILSSNSNTIFFVAKCEQKIVGYCGMYTVLDEGYVTNIGVLPDYRRRGIGCELLNALIKYCKDVNISFLSLEVRQSNAAAIKLYKKFEFKTVGTRKNFYRDPTEDANIMTRFFK